MTDPLMTATYVIEGFGSNVLLAWVSFASCYTLADLIRRMINR